MKKVSLLLMLMAMGVATYAQTAYEKAKFLDNTYVGVEVGATSPLDFNSMFPVNAVAGVKVGKDVTPVLGFNAEGLVSLGDNHYASIGTFVKAVNVGLNSTVNLSNLIAGYGGSPRFVEVGTEVGLGWLHRWQVDANYLTAKTGATIAFNLGAEKAHSLFVNPAVFWNLTANGKVRFDKGNAQLGLIVGYVYHFRTSNGTHSFKVHDIGAMNDRISELQAELAKKPREVVKEVSVTRTVERVVPVRSEYVVFFAQDSHELTDDARALLDGIASDNSVEIVAFASPEGGADYNQKLSESRAKAVSDYLKGKGIAVTAADGKGVQGDASGRVAIITLK